MKNNKNWYTGEDAKILEAYIKKFRGVFPNPLNMKTFGEILAIAKKELEADKDD